MMEQRTNEVIELYNQLIVNYVVPIFKTLGLYVDDKERIKHEEEDDYLINSQNQKTIIVPRTLDDYDKIIMQKEKKELFNPFGKTNHITAILHIMVSFLETIIDLSDYDQETTDVDSIVEAIKVKIPGNQYKISVTMLQPDDSKLLMGEGIHPNVCLAGLIACYDSLKKVKPEFFFTEIDPQELTNDVETFSIARKAYKFLNNETIDYTIEDDFEDIPDSYFISEEEESKLRESLVQQQFHKDEKLQHNKKIPETIDIDIDDNQLISISHEDHIVQKENIDEESIKAYFRIFQLDKDAVDID